MDDVAVEDDIRDIKVGEGDDVLLVDAVAVEDGGVRDVVGQIDGVVAAEDGAEGERVGLDDVVVTVAALSILLLQQHTDFLAATTRELFRATQPTP